MRRHKGRTAVAVLVVAVLVALGPPSTARADVKIWTWGTGIDFEVGAVAKDGGVIYKCKLAHTSAAGNQPPNATYWDAMNAWSTGQAYAVGDLVYYGTPPDIYRCNQAHTSAAGNAPGNNPPWQKPFPQDPAVKTGGHGPSGNDYIDY